MLNPAPPSISPAPDEPKEPSGLHAPGRRARSWRSIGETIVELGFASSEQLAAAVEEAKVAGRRPEEVLVAQNTITVDNLVRATAERLGLDHVDLTVYEPDLAAANLLGPRSAKRYNAVPIGFHETGQLLVAMADPSNVLALDDLKIVTGHEIRPVVASPEDVAGLIARMNRLDDAVAQAVEDEGPAEVVEIRESAEDAPVIRLVNSIIAQAAGDGASDIHFEPSARDMRVRFRVDGVLSDRATIPRGMVAGVVSRVKIMSELDIAERRLPQDGRVGLTVEGRPLDIRVVTLPGVLGEGLVMRLLDKEQVLLDLDTLGMPDDGRARFEAAFHAAYGAVLVTGPTGSGKSTTLYAALNKINSIESNIITIEDPVEYQVPGINQLQVSRKAGLTFASGLRSMLRADPDVIMVGEIRDGDTAKIAVESALTGHLVLSTLHTNDAPSAMARLTEMGVEPFLTASAVDCVVAQRLARRLCGYCRRETVLEAAALRAAGFETDDDLPAWEGMGCGRCNFSGYRGRIGLYEVMTVSDEIRSMVIDRASAAKIRAKAVEQGMRLLRADGFDKVALGVTSISEVARVS